MNMKIKALYDILEVDPSLSTEEIRERYRKLCLRYHPDKRNSRAPLSEDAIKSFCEIQEAWEILRNPITRKEYDETLRQRDSLPLIYEEVDLDDMLYSVTHSQFSYPCRCGDQYYLSEEELEKGYDIIGCSSCSLAISIKYHKEEEG
jgi:diphthamide biosynthesis protein 4